MERKVKTFFTHSNPIAIRPKLAHHIKDINEKLKLINQEARDFGLQTMKPVGAGPVVGQETDSFTADPIVLGREDDVSGIVEMLTTSPTEQVFSVLPIVGMGGLGKTTLARQVFNNEKIKAHFGKQIWVYVSRNFDAMIIFKKILESLTTENKVDIGNREAILRKLQQELGHKRYLLVLDNVWNEEREKWEDFLNSLSGISSVIGNGIIVTTRGEHVASIVRTLPIYELKSLPMDECWSIIKAKAFREREIPLELEIIGRNIGERCQGLPLAAKVVGGFLSEKSKDEWLSIKETWHSKFGEDKNTILKVLKYSFDHLSSPSLKKCFAYCSIFPKGSTIKREQLIELWIAEGFVTTDQSNDLETGGNNFFNLLVQNSLLQVVTRDNYGNITDCNMHDLVHDLASSVLGSKSNYVNDKSLNDIHQVRYIAESCPIPKEHSKCVRTLIFENKVSDNMFLDFKSLHVLVLKCQDVRELPGSISELIHLRLLDISYTRIESLPDSIGRLYHLQMLRTIPEDKWKNSSSMCKLPNTLKNLISLRHLHISNIELPPEIGRLTSLQTLPYFQVGNDKGCRLGELGSLKNLKGELEIGNLERVVDKEEAKSAHLIRKPDIFKLKFRWNALRETGRNDENMLEGLQPHPNLKSLEIYGFKGRSFPLWILRMEIQEDLEGRWIGLNNLVEIRLSNCRECEEIPTLGHLPNLKSLYLCGLTNVTSIGSSFYGIDNYNISNGIGKNIIILFPALEKLELSEMPNLREWLEVEFPSGAKNQVHELVVFPCLEYLVISECYKLTSAPSHFPCLKRFEIRTMESASPLANICGSNLISLTNLQIERVNGLICLPYALFHNNQNLSELRIWHCPNLTHLISPLQGGKKLLDGLHNLSSLEELFISNCPNLKSISYPSGRQSHKGFTSLRRLTIVSCKRLTNLATEMIESCSPSLEYLSLIGLSSLTNLPMVISYLQNMHRLTGLGIVDVPKITDLSIEIGSLHCLQSLHIGAFSSASSDYRLVREFLNDIFIGSKSLRRLDLYGMEDWDSLPDQLEHLTGLSHLEALPEWIGNMSFLKAMYMHNCT